MKKILHFLLVSLIFCALTVSLQAETSLWKVESSEGGSTLFIGGTCHLLRPSDFPLPAEFDVAYGAAQTLVFETDLGKMMDPQTQQLIMAKGMLENGKTLPEILSPEAYEQLEGYCKKFGLPMAALNGLKPSILITMLTVMELQKMGISMEGVDMHYYAKAKADGKTLGKLETVEEQVEFICSMGEGEESKFVIHSIWDMEETKEYLPKLLDAWKTGDRAVLSEILVNEFKTDFPALYKSLILDRNNNWMPEIEALLESEETELILVGAGHVVGEDGILNQLEKLGCMIEQVSLEPAMAE